MVFIASGTHRQSFKRAIHWIQIAEQEHLVCGPIVVQTARVGSEGGVVWKDILPELEFIHLIRKADVLITHGGPATIVTALSEGRVPIIIPRERQYREHVDDHQVQFAKVLASIGLPVARTLPALRALLNDDRNNNLNADAILRKVSTGFENLSLLFTDLRHQIR